MTESWLINGSSTRSTPLDPAEVASTLRTRIDEGLLETWLASSSGRLLAFVTNSQRAMIMLLAGPGDHGEHAVDPGADGESGGFVLSNGQDDEYPDTDTVPLDEALRIVTHIVDTGSWPADAHRVAD